MLRWLARFWKSFYSKTLKNKNQKYGEELPELNVVKVLLKFLQRLSKGGAPQPHAEMVIIPT